MTTEVSCQSCRFYRVKAELGTGLLSDEIGKCDNHMFHKQVRATGRSLLRILRLDERDIEEALDLRVRGDFGCKNYADAEVVE